MLLVILLIAAVSPLVALVRLSRWNSAYGLSANGAGSVPRPALAVAAVMSLVAASLAGAGPTAAEENDMHLFSGTVTDASGAPLAEMKVSVFCHGCSDGLTSDPSRDPARPWPAETWGAGSQLLGEATTGASGDWTVAVAEPASGSPLVVAWDPDGDYAFAEVELPPYEWDSAVQTGLEVSLVDGARLSGRILAEGAAPPATGFVLIGAAGWGGLLWTGFSLVVSDGGEYLTPGLPNGDYALRYPGGLYSGSLEAPYVAGGIFALGTISGGRDSVADHHLAQYSSVSGRVTDGSGNGLGGVEVYASPVGVTANKFYASPVGRGGRVTTAENGTYQLDSLAPDLYVLSFGSFDDGHVSEFLPVHVSNVGVRGADAQLGPGGTISGLVRYIETGEPAARAQIRLCIEVAQSADPVCIRGWNHTDESGLFELDGVAAGSYRLIASPYPLPDVEKSIVLAEGGHVQVEFVVGSRGAFSDDDGAFHEGAFNALAERGIFARTECDRDKICPDDPISRSTIAVWLGRALTGEEPPSIENTRFADVARSDWTAPHIERFAELGVTAGCNVGPPRYCPDAAVTRGEMAAFLVRAFELPDAPPAGFSDTAGHFVESKIDALAAAGVTSGCADNPPRYCPNARVTRGQMAVFIARAIDTLEGTG